MALKYRNHLKGDTCPKPKTVTLTDGSKYLGWISEWTYDPNESDQDFLLSNAQKIDENFNMIYEIDGKGIYLRTSWVVSIEFFKGQAAAEANQTLQEAAPMKENPQTTSIPQK